MKAIIIGAGEVGFHTARTLTAEKDNDIRLIDQSAAVCQSVQEQLDLIALQGSGASPNLLKKAGIEDADMLNELDMKIFKIPSFEIINLELLEHIASLRKPIILSTGMADESEIETALDILEASGTQREKITILHCNTAYPTPMKDVNLRAMIGLREKFGVVVGYSDHTLGIEVPVAAVAMGARVIEKHLTLDRNLPGPDHLSSLMPNEFEQMTKAIRSIEIALGDGVKQVSPSERENRLKVRKSIVASKVIKVGEEYSLGNLTTKRPGKGLSPMCWDQVIGRRAERDYQKDELIDPI